jgi:hypothetical protein
MLGTEPHRWRRRRSWCARQSVMMRCYRQRNLPKNRLTGLHDLHYDGGIEHQNNEGGGSLAETSEPALSTGSQNRETGQEWTGTSPLLFTIAASSMSGASDMKSVAGRVRRRLSSQGVQNPESEDDLPSARTKRRRSSSSTRFSVIAGMPSGS